MVKIQCINSKDRPNDIPKSKWIEYGEIYSVNFIVRCLPQNVLAFGLYEKPLDESCHPYQYFISTRFAVKPEDVDELLQMHKDLAELPESILSELLGNSNLINQ